MSLRDRLARAVGAEQKMGRWHYPSYTSGCGGSHKHAKCYICKLRWNGVLAKLFARLRKA